MPLLKLLNVQGIVGLAVAAILTVLLIGAKIDARHWKKQSTRFEQLYRDEAKAHNETVANYRTAAEAARQADAANKRRVKTLQEKVNEERDAAYAARIAAARLRANQAPANSGGARTAPVSGVPNPAGRPDGATAEAGLSAEDRLIATEQAIQLDELIKWVKAQMGINLEGDQ